MLLQRRTPTGPNLYFEALRLRATHVEQRLPADTDIAINLDPQRSTMPPISKPRNNLADLTDLADLSACQISSCIHPFRMKLGVSL